MFVFGVDVSKKLNEKNISTASLDEMCLCFNKESGYAYNHKNDIVFISADSRDLPLSKTKYDIFSDIARNVSQCFGINVLMDDVRLFKIG